MSCASSLYDSKNFLFIGIDSLEKLFFKFASCYLMENIDLNLPLYSSFFIIFYLQSLSYLMEMSCLGFFTVVCCFPSGSLYTKGFMCRNINGRHLLKKTFGHSSATSN